MTGPVAAWGAGLTVAVLGYIALASWVGRCLKRRAAEQTRTPPPDDP
ncbi:hypothetical protein ACEZCY_13945 [Streptacidiphilus sp. N1-12]|uniref:Uncharacterized protein n=2 Tax=Streptacidiphilus alkalitolerans TaxID=3342712 RepID=A0ABV6WF16_9ACTN